MHEGTKSSGNSAAVVVVCVLAGLGFLVLAVIGVGAAFVYMQVAAFDEMMTEDVLLDDMAMATKQVTVRCSANGDCTMDGQAMTFSQIKSQVEQSYENVVLNIYVDPDCPYAKVKELEDFCVDSFNVYDFYFNELKDGDPLPAASAYDQAMGSDIATDETTIKVRCDSVGDITIDGESLTFEQLKERVENIEGYPRLAIFADPKCPFKVVKSLEDFCINSERVIDHVLEQLPEDAELPEAPFMDAMSVESRY